MRNVMTLLFVGLLTAPLPAANNPPAKEWQPLIDAAISAIRKKDTPALDKLLMSFAEADAACATNSSQAKEAVELDKRRPRRIAGAMDDCNIMNWKTARFVSASGGEPLPSKCGRFTRATNISLLYEDSDLMWTVTLEPVVLNGKRLIAAPPNCLASVKK